jgi:predicted GNAT family acetyltransferase
VTESTELPNGELPNGEPQYRVEHHPDERRFVLSEQAANTDDSKDSTTDDDDRNDLAHVEYVVRNGMWVFTHTFTEPEARHRGLAGRVVAAALQGARSEGVSIAAVCPFVTDYVAEHPEYRDLLDPQ